MILNSKLLDNLADQLTNVIPPGLQHLTEDLQKNFRSIVQSFFAKLDFVTREEFDAQVKVLQRTREMAASLEQIIKEFEDSLQQKK